MNIKNFTLICIVTVTSATITGAEFLRPRNPMVLMGSVQFPQSLEMVPHVRFYRSGISIESEIDNKSKKASFSIMDDRSQLHFTLLITDCFAFHTEHNTGKYIKIDPQQPYKYYILTLKEITPDSPEYCAKPKGSTTQYTWVVKEVPLPFPNGRVPDDTLIMCYNPDFIDSVRGGNVVALPTIFIKPNIVALVGSEDKLHDASDELVLSSIDYNMLHVHSKREIRQDFAHKTIVTLTT